MDGVPQSPVKGGSRRRRRPPRRAVLKEGGTGVASISPTRGL